MTGVLFRDRRGAGRQLAATLMRFKDAAPLVLALPRGGVPVAFEVAKALRAPLDVLFVRKIGVPGHDELALAAIVDGAEPQLVLNEEIARSIPLPDGYLEDAKMRQLAEIERRRHLYRSGRPAERIDGRTVIVVDDGIATGATVKAALRGTRRNRPARLILAVPVAPSDALADLASECDEIACLASPEPFHAVGVHYLDFDQTSDEEAIRLLDEARNEGTGPR